MAYGQAIALVALNISVYCISRWALAPVFSASTVASAKTANPKIQF
jgi:hypothetical protein